MVDKLSPDNEKDGDSVIMVALVFVHVDGHISGGGKGISGDGGPGCGDTVSVVRSHPPVVTIHGSAPVRHLQVVTDALHTSVSLHLTLRGHQEGGAVGLNDGLGGVDQGQTVGDGVLGERILLGQVPGSLVDHSSQVSHIQPGELSSDRGQAHLLLGRLEGGVDGLVGHAGVLSVEGGRSASKHIVGVVKQRGLGRPWDDEGTSGGRGRSSKLGGDYGQ